MISLFGSEKRFPFVPEDSNIAPIDAALPMQMVDTSQFI
jgi:hypothetical protein